MSIFQQEPRITANCDYLDSIVQFCPFKWHFTEGLSKAYEGMLSLVTNKPLTQAQIDTLIYRPIQVSWRNEFSQKRFINGFVFTVHAYQDKKLIDHYCYRLIIKSWYSALQFSKDTAVYVNQDLQTILRAVLKPHQIYEYDFSNLRKTYAPRPYTVRYDDTAENFVNRILYESGVYFSFKQKDKDTYLTLHDSGFGHSAVEDKMVVYPDKTKPTDLVGVGIWDWVYQVNAQSDAVSTFIYDRAQNKFSPNKKANINYAKRGKATEWFAFPAFENYAENKVMQAFFETAQCAYSCNDLTMIPGARFLVSKHPNQASIGKYWVDTVETLMTDYRQLDETTTSATIDIKAVAVPDNSGYFPAPTFTPVYAQGIDSATVVAPKGQEVYSDEQARVKVKFEWDRQTNSFADSSCWVPVKQAWTGYDHGTLFVPRSGQEVIIAYEDGNPEKPIVIGTLPNQQNMPPFKPEQNPFQSGYKSHTPGDHVFKNGNILLFDDHPNSASVTLQAQKDLNLTAQGDKQTTISDDYTQTIKSGNYQQTTGGTLTITSNSKIQLAVGMSRVLVDQSGIVIESPKLNINEAVVPGVAPAPLTSADESLKKLLATLKLPEQSNAQATVAKENATPIKQAPIVDVVYSTGQKTFYFLTAEEKKLIDSESQPFKDAMTQLYQAEKASLQAGASIAEKTALLQARQTVNDLLSGLIGSDNFQELVKIKEQGWAYLPNKVLEKIGVSAEVKTDSGQIMYTPKYKQWGKYQDQTILMKKSQGQPKLITANTSKVNVSDALASFKSLDDLKSDLFQFDIGTYDKKLTDFGSHIEKDLTKEKDVNLGWSDLKATSDARILRYTAKAGVNGNYDPQKHILAVNTGGEAAFNLFYAEGNTRLTFPGNVQGYHGKVQLTETDDGCVDLGYFKCETDLKVYSEAGASILAYGELEASANPAFESATQKVKDVLHSSNLLKGTLNLAADDNATNASGAQAQAEAFAGIEAGCYLDGKFYWKSPETVQPVQNPNKASEKLGKINGIGESSWVELADLGAGVAADLGIGGDLGFCIKYHSNKFVIICHAKFVYGTGASGKMQIAIDADHINQFIQFVYHQLKNENFSNLIYENLMDPKATSVLNIFLIAILWQATTEMNFIEHGKSVITDWYNENIYPYLHHKELRSQVIKLAQNILSDKIITHYLPPESKGRLLYHLSEYFIALVDTDTRPAQAMMKILTHVQSAQELIRTYANVTMFDPNETITTTLSETELAQKAIAGQKILLKNLQVTQIDEILDKEQVLAVQNNIDLNDAKKLFHSSKIHLINTEDKFVASIKQMVYNTHINMNAYINAGAINVIEAMYTLGKTMRETALKQQKINQYQVDSNTLNTLRQKAKNETLMRDIANQAALQDLQNSWWQGM